MTVMQKMGIDQNTVEGLNRILSVGCRDIPDKYGKNVTEHGCARRITCSKCKAERLFTEVPTKTVSRWETIKSDADVEKIKTDWISNGDECDACGYTGEKSLRDCIACFVNHLTEKVEVEA